MENKLQELTRKLYDEGLSKGKQEAEGLVSEAKKQAEKIVADARKEAEKILKNAETSAEDLRKNTLTELNLAGRQTIEALKGQIEGMILFKSVTPAINAANADPQFVKSLLLEVASNWCGDSSGRVELNALLPESKREQWKQFLSGAAAKDFAEGLEITFDNKVKSGFRIGPRDGSFYVSFTDADFEGLLGDYLRPQVADILFGEETK